MVIHKGIQPIGQLEKKRGGYFFLKIDAAVVERVKHKRKTRLICKLENQVEFQCSLNHLGDGNFFIILSRKNLLLVGKEIGNELSFELYEDPDPLGVKIPEVLAVLLEQDDDLKKTFETLTLGKKRSVIHQIIKMKDIDLQVSKSIELINVASIPQSKRN